MCRYFDDFHYMKIGQSFVGIELLEMDILNGFQICRAMSFSNAHIK